MTDPEKDATPDIPTTKDHVLGGRLALMQAARGHRVGHDAILLAAFAPAGLTRMVDLGAGVGSAGLAFLTRCPDATGALVEIDPQLAALARENVALNGMAARCAVICGDVEAVARPQGPELPAPGAADLVLMNPPYNDSAAHRAPPDAGRARAYMAPPGLLHAWVTAASRALRPGGVLCLIHRPQDLALILAALEGRFGAIELLPVHPRPDRPAARLLVRALKERRTAPAFLPGLVLTDDEGRPSPLAQAVLRDAQALAVPGR